MPRPTREQMEEVNQLLQEGAELLDAAERIAKAPGREQEAGSMAHRGRALMNQANSLMDSFGPREEPKPAPPPPPRSGWLPAIPYEDLIGGSRGRSGGGSGRASRNGR